MIFACLSSSWFKVVPLNVILVYLTSNSEIFYKKIYYISNALSLKRFEDTFLKFQTPVPPISQKERRRKKNKATSKTVLNSSCRPLDRNSSGLTDRLQPRVSVSYERTVNCSPHTLCKYTTRKRHTLLASLLGQTQPINRIENSTISFFWWYARSSPAMSKRMTTGRYGRVRKGLEETLDRTQSQK